MKTTFNGICVNSDSVYVYGVFGICDYLLKLNSINFYCNSGHPINFTVCFTRELRRLNNTSMSQTI